MWRTGTRNGFWSSTLWADGRRGRGGDVALGRRRNAGRGADRDDNAVSVLNAGTLERIGTNSVGERPFGFTVDPEGRRAYTANVGSNDGSVIDPDARQVVGTMKVGQRPYAIALVGDRAFVTNQYDGTVSVLDT